MQNFDLGSVRGWMLATFLNIGFGLSYFNLFIGVITGLVGISTIALNVQKFVQNRKKQKANDE